MRSHIIASEARRARYTRSATEYTHHHEKLVNIAVYPFGCPCIHFARRERPSTFAALSAGLDLQSLLFLNKRFFALVGLCAQPKSIFKTNSRRRARHMINLTQQLEALFCTRLGVGPRLKLWMMHNCVRSPTHTQRLTMLHFSICSHQHIYMCVCAAA